ncbi:MAG: ABC transporter substrate-binding protein [Acidobacteria bacterium]|nr:ABC transporter substrate-binding protein [Acidobacteriota bacterium]MBS1867415.1 ABC transporter substrate-binding protein [Acidobacteriota bacterium]
MKVRSESALRRTCGYSLVILVCVLALGSCHKTAKEETSRPPTITFVGWGPATFHELVADRNIVDEFTKQTGIPVDFIPGPESMTDRLQLYKEYLSRKSPTPDVYYLDVIWPGELADDMLDLEELLAKEAKDELPSAIENDTVNGKLVAMPFNIELALLYYRQDLLKKYGYGHPPETWDELEKMAAKIQAGERAAGNHDFWGYVWQGAAYEGLTCNAFEWQVSYGGGQIIEPDGAVSVNNPRAIQAIKRAKSWIGKISPPSVTAFREQDSVNVFNAGNAAFARDWIWREYPRPNLNPVIRERIAIALMPSGPARRASTMGGQSLAISKYSKHPKEAAAFLQFLTSRETQLELWKEQAMFPGIREFYENPKYRQSRPDIDQIWDQLQRTVVARPSTISGKHYDQVSRAYFGAVHSVLTNETTAEKAFAELEKKLKGIMAPPGQAPSASPVAANGHTE